MHIWNFTKSSAVVCDLYCTIMPTDKNSIKYCWWQSVWDSSHDICIDSYSNQAFVCRHRRMWRRTAQMSSNSLLSQSDRLVRLSVWLRLLRHKKNVLWYVAILLTFRYLPNYIFYISAVKSQGGIFGQTIIITLLYIRVIEHITLL